MTATTFHVDSLVQASPGRSEDEVVDQAVLRAYSIERSVDYGCSLQDVLTLRRRVEAGHEWVGTALLLAYDNEKRALRGERAHQSSLAIRYLAQAVACCRLAQAGLDTLVNNAEAQQLVDIRGPGATLKYWPEGVHCLYNHATERNCVLAEWFVRKLG